MAVLLYLSQMKKMVTHQEPAAEVMYFTAITCPVLFEILLKRFI